MEKIVVITGPTGVGKTELALKLAQQLGAEVVSADSRQVYQGMDIGTAKPTILEQSKVKHHLLDLVAPDEPFSLATYQALAYDAIDRILMSGSKPLLVGGTGLYIQAVVDGLKIPHLPPDPLLRSELEKLEVPELVRRLEVIDPDSVKAIPPTNKRRLIRAIEVSELSGQPFSVIGRLYHRRYESLQIGLTAPREELYRRADERVEEWLKQGWLGEVKDLKSRFPDNLPSMSSLGYRQMGMFLDGKISLPEATKRVKFDIHGYIRRQMTWFRRDARIYWFDTTIPGWESDVEKQISSWYAKSDEHQ